MTPGLDYALTVMFCTIGAVGMTSGAVIEGFALNKIKNIQDRSDDEPAKKTANKLTRVAWLAIATFGASIAALGSFLFVLCGLCLILGGRLPPQTVATIAEVGAVLTGVALIPIQWKAFHWAFDQKKIVVPPTLTQRAAS